MGDGSVKNGLLVLPIPWTSDGGGDASVTIANYHGYLLLSAKSAPGQDGDLTTDLPSNPYSIVLNDAYSEDIMATALSAVSGLVSVTKYPTTPIPIISALTVVVSGAGATNQGLLILTLQQN